MRDSPDESLGVIDDRVSMGDPTTGARIFFWVAMGIWGGLEVRTSIVRAGSDTGEDAGSQRWSLGATLGGLLAVLLIDLAMPEIIVSDDKQAPFLVAGGVFVLGGVALRIWSIRTLGRFFTYQVMTTDAQHVVTGGPYRFARHPSYTALLISCLGAGISTANPFSVIAAIIIPLIGLTRRIHIEEAVLLRALGDEYQAFCSTRKRLVPGVW